MSDESQLSAQAEDEIDLLDLFTVLIKHRRIIIISTLLVILLSMVGYFFYPSWKYNRAPQREISKTICRVMTAPTLSKEETRFELITLFSSTPSVFRAMEKSGFQKVGGYTLDSSENRKRALNWLEVNFPLEIIDENNDLDKKTYSINPASQIIKISYTNTNSDQAEMFLSHLFNEVSAQLLSDSRISEPSLILFDKPYTVLETGNTLSQIKSSYIKKAAITFLAVFFFSLFLAFILEFVDKIKKDEERMAKIRKALGK